jgi:hypothetical protein
MMTSPTTIKPGQTALDWALSDFGYIRLCRVDGINLLTHATGLNQLGLCYSMLLISSFFMNRGETLMHNTPRFLLILRHLFTGFFLGVVLLSGASRSKE